MATGYDQLLSDYYGYFKEAKPGDTREWAGGTLVMGSGGVAEYKAPGGYTYYLSPTTDPKKVAQENPIVRNLWEARYGVDLSSEEPEMPVFHIPTTTYPTSTTKSSSASTVQTGIDWSGQVASATIGPIKDQIDALTQMVPAAKATLMPQANAFSQQMGNMSQGLLDHLSSLSDQGVGAINSSIQTGQQGVAQASGLADALNRAAKYAIRQAVQSPAGLQGLLNSLGARNMLSSSVASDLISKLTGAGLQQASQAAYQAEGQGQQAIMEALNRLAQIQQGAAQGLAGIGQMRTTGTSAAGQLQAAGMQNQLAVQQLLGELSKIAPAALAQFAKLDKVARSSSASQSTGENTNPLAPYELMAQLFGLMV